MSKITIEQFRNNFRDLPIPQELINLLSFQDSVKGCYSEGFKLGVYSDKLGLKTYSEDEEFLSSLIEFASADRTGSTYAFWIQNRNTDLSKTPVVLLGSEGGYHIIAENINQLLQLLTYDVEPIASWERVFYYKDDKEHQSSEEIDNYRKWAWDNHQISTLTETDFLIGQAQAKYQDEFNGWMKNYIKGKD